MDTAITEPSEQEAFMKKPARRGASEPAKSTRRGQKKLFCIGLLADEREALSKAALSEDRSSAYIARRVLLTWLKEEGWLK
jgi:hypothetical protein